MPDYMESPARKQRENAPVVNLWIMVPPADYTAKASKSASWNTGK